MLYNISMIIILSYDNYTFFWLNLNSLLIILFYDLVNIFL